MKKIFGFMHSYSYTLHFRIFATSISKNPEKYPSTLCQIMGCCHLFILLLNLIAFQMHSVDTCTHSFLLAAPEIHRTAAE